MVIVFDLDDTLYEELSFVRSGFAAVADYLHPLLNLPRDQIAAALMNELQTQREQVFDRFLAKQGISARKWVKNCLRVYRAHEPILALYPEARRCLTRLQHLSLYVVTDGNPFVQRKKCLALGLVRFVKRCFFTYAHGLRYRKPSPYCFEKICRLEKVEPSSVVYVADNPHKDFVGLKPLGFQTIRVLTGPYKQDKVTEAYDAQWKIANLDYLTDSLIMTGREE